MSSLQSVKNWGDAKPMKKTSRLLLKVSSVILIAIFGCVAISFVIAAVYQSTRGNASLSEVARNVNLPEDAEQGADINSQVASLTFEEVQAKYRDLDDEQWREYAKGILGSRVRWSGKVTDKDNRRVEIDMGSDPLQYLYLIYLSEGEKENIKIGDTLAFDGRIQSFHLMKGMNIVMDYVILGEP
jgi:hypothetical protein